MPVDQKVTRRLSEQIDRAELARVAGVSPAKNEVVVSADLAANRPTLFRNYYRWQRLGPTATGHAQPVEHRSEDQREFSLDRVGGILLAIGVLAFVAGSFVLGFLLLAPAIALVAYHHLAAVKSPKAPKPVLPVFVSLAPKGTLAHRLVESLEVDLVPAVAGAAPTFAEKVVRADGRLDLVVRQRDPRTDALRRDVYTGRFGPPKPSDVSLGYLVLDRPAVATWSLPEGAAAGLRVASPRVLRLGSPGDGDLRTISPKDAREARTWTYSAPFVLNDPLPRTPSISASVMIDPTSAGNSLRLTFARAVDDRAPNVRIRVSAIAGRAHVATGGIFKRPSVEVYRGPGHGDGAGSISPSMEDDAQRHPPEFALVFNDTDDFLPGDRLTVYLVFEKSIVPQPTDEIGFALQLELLDAAAGFNRIALFDPLGAPVTEREPSAGSDRQPRAVFAPPTYRESFLLVRGVLSASRLLVTSEDTLKATTTVAGRLPDASLVHELITALVLDHRLAIRDVREDLAERSAADRGALVWTILAKGSENLLSPDVTLRVAGTRSLGAGQDGTNIEISVIARHCRPAELNAARELSAEIARSAQSIAEAFTARRGAEEAVSSRDSSGVSETLTARGGDVEARLEHVVLRAEAIIERFERLFRP